jgi:hypothetical protein
VHRLDEIGDAPCGLDRQPAGATKVGEVVALAGQDTKLRLGLAAGKSPQGAASDARETG